MLINFTLWFCSVINHHRHRHPHQRNAHDQAPHLCSPETKCTLRHAYLFITSIHHHPLATEHHLHNFPSLPYLHLRPWPLVSCLYCVALCCGHDAMIISVLSLLGREAWWSHGVLCCCIERFCTYLYVIPGLDSFFPLLRSFGSALCAVWIQLWSDNCESCPGDLGNFVMVKYLGSGLVRSGMYFSTVGAIVSWDAVFPWVFLFAPLYVWVPNLWRSWVR